MKQVQYQIIRIKDSKLMGWLVGKTQDQFGTKFLIVDVGPYKSVVRLRIDEKTMARYRVDAVEVSA